MFELDKAYDIKVAHVWSSTDRMPPQLEEQGIGKWLVKATNGKTFETYGRSQMFHDGDEATIKITNTESFTPRMVLLEKK